MSRLYDDILESGKLRDYPEGDEWLFPTTVIDATEISASMGRDTKDDRYRRWLSYPVCNPMFDHIFIETRAFPTSEIWGAFIWTISNEQSLEIMRQRAHPPHENARFLSLFWLYIQPAFSAQPVASKIPFSRWESDPDIRLEYDRDGRLIDRGPVGGIEQTYLDPFIFALALIHSKNVELVDRRPSHIPREKDAERAPAILFKTIKVNPMRTVQHPTEEDAVRQHCEQQAALAPHSLWRGHFKDFRDGNGLFGRYKGVYWWDQHVRGAIENGITIKDYEVQAPRQESKS